MKPALTFYLKHLLLLVLPLLRVNFVHGQFFNSLEATPYPVLASCDQQGNIYYNSKTTLLKVDGLNQTVLWQAEIDAVEPAGFKVCTTDSSGNTVVCTVGGSGPNNLSMVRSIAPNGSLLWQKQINSYAYTCMRPCLVARDKTIYLANTAGIAPNGIIKLSSSGNVLWSKIYQAAGLTGNITAILEKKNGNLYAAGYNAQADTTVITVFEIDTAGTLLWNKCYKMPRVLVNARNSLCAKLTSKNEIILAVDCKPINQNAWPVLVKTDSLGSLIWAKKLTNDSASQAYLMDMELDASNTIFVSRYSFSNTWSSSDILRYYANTGSLLNAAYTNSIDITSLKVIRPNELLLAGRDYATWKGLIGRVDSSFTGVCGFSVTGSSDENYQLNSLQYSLVASTFSVSLTSIPNNLVGGSVVRQAACNSVMGVSDVERGSTAQLRIFPNPAQDIVIVETEEACTLRLYNQLSQLVLQQTIVAGKNNLDVSTLPKGIYYLRSETVSGMRYNKRLLIE